jgi:hypothetical protein
MRGGATEVNETQKWATSKKRLRTTALRNTTKNAQDILYHNQDSNSTPPDYKP